MSTFLNTCTRTALFYSTLLGRVTRRCSKRKKKKKKNKKKGVAPTFKQFHNWYYKWSFQYIESCYSIRIRTHGVSEFRFFFFFFFFFLLFFLRVSQMSFLKLRVTRATRAFYTGEKHGGKNCILSMALFQKVFETLLWNWTNDISKQGKFIMFLDGDMHVQLYLNSLVSTLVNVF